MNHYSKWLQGQRLCQYSCSIPDCFVPRLCVHVYCARAMTPWPVCTDCTADFKFAKPCPPLKIVEGNWFALKLIFCFLKIRNNKKIVQTGNNLNLLQATLSRLILISLHHNCKQMNHTESRTLLDKGVADTKDDLLEQMLVNKFLILWVF